MEIMIFLHVKNFSMDSTFFQKQTLYRSYFTFTFLFAYKWSLLVWSLYSSKGVSLGTPTNLKGPLQQFSHIDMVFENKNNQTSGFIFDTFLAGFLIYSLPSGSLLYQRDGIWTKTREKKPYADAVVVNWFCNSQQTHTTRLLLAVYQQQPLLSESLKRLK